MMGVVLYLSRIKYNNIKFGFKSGMLWLYAGAVPQPKMGIDEIIQITTQLN
jgi:hypothetical protein